MIPSKRLFHGEIIAILGKITALKQGQ